LSLWTEYLALQTSLAHSVLSVVLRDEIETVPTIRAVQAGETIIKQGQPADTVYTLIEGKAEVLVDGVKVGEVLRDEIFGALAAFNGGARTASVITTENSLVVSLPLGEFSMLVESRPRLVVKLIQDLARAISALNSRVVDKF
jgi:CRP-like cAMP-binding protein